MNRIILISVRAVVAIVAASAPALLTAAYDAEDHLGLVADDRSTAIAIQNTRLLNAALEAHWPGGRFEFRDGNVGPVLEPIEFRGKEFCFAGTIETATRFGGTLRGAGGRVPYLPAGHYLRDGTLGGSTTRFTRIDGERGGAMLRIRACGFVVSGIEFRGRLYDHDPTGEGPDGAQTTPKNRTRTPVGIEIEGRGQPPVGWNTFRDCSVFSCTVGVCCRGGYYKSNSEFVPHENHADQSTIDGIVFTDVDVCWRTENQQAVNWSIRDLALNGIGGRGLKHQVIFDIARGTVLYADNVAVNASQSTLVRIADSYSPWANSIIIRNVKWDRGIALSNNSYAKIIELQIPENSQLDVANAKWHIRIDGNFSYDRWYVEKPLDVSKLIDVPKRASNFPLTDILFDIAGLDRLVDFEDKFETVGMGPWVRPSKQWIPR